MKLKYIPVLIVTVFLFSCTSCNESKPSNDKESTIDQDNNTQFDDDPTDPDVDIADADLKDDNKLDEIPDIDEDTYCPPLKEAGFPYSRIDGSIHFCRKCDTSTELDPDCVSNLWKEPNEVLCKEHPDLDCCGYPCVMENLTPIYYGDEGAIYLDKCDIELDPTNPIGWQTGMKTFKHYNLSEGKIGMVMDHALSATFSEEAKPADMKAIEFDLDTRMYKVARMSSSNDIMAYNKGSMFNGVSLKGIDKNSAYKYLIYSDSSGKMSVAMNEPVRFITGNPVINDKWVFINVEIKDGDPDRMMYAKIGVWKWTVIGEGDTGGDPNLVGDKLAFYDQGFKGYVCDLSKSPKSRDDCIKLNREGERIATPIIDKENENLIYYENIDTSKSHKIGKVDISKTPFKYEEIDIPGLSAGTKTLPVIQVKGDTILLTNVFNPVNDEAGDPQGDGKVCYYRISKKKSYCALPVEHNDGIMAYRMSYPEIEGHWLVWQDDTQPAMKLRDMECYCDHHPELCPFDDYTPQPDNPKDPKTGKRLTD
ncbi:MAG TPA: hypothetical protein PLD55_13025 [bacterium]|nr:hypothetical protein [bacterium]HPY15524.1 hypothetical protein [bacterium]HQM85595.1 hypothetical protein [bacterium]